ncbi:DUF4190 domain-containing protein [Micromonospora sp. HM5-17]|uniref:DUF4190 domain-containing protein n=1 Tax=Micromonospora sp. HM5-17 TaxID=2487710 RepID=UPI000F4AAF5A|nr:DUF4190 domain-containing protein [Micromonospora sp. HM5-17]ROT32007.1 DUF4190 domain-containing protein [Micromonospora sp. HM5-17]
MTDPQPSTYSSDSSWQAPSVGGDPNPTEPTIPQETVYQPGYPAESSGSAGYPTSGNPSAAGPPPGVGYPGYPGAAYPVVVPPQANGMSIAALVVSIVGMLGICAYGLGGYLGIVGAILGHISRKQIRERGEGGDGLALAGIIVGWIAGGIAILATIAIIVIIVISVKQGSSYDS